jgi:hypothetical protein
MFGCSPALIVPADPAVLAPLKLHYLRWQVFPIGDDMYFEYQGYFDTDFDKYTEDAVALFSHRYRHRVHQPGGLSRGLEGKSCLVRPVRP